MISKVTLTSHIHHKREDAQKCNNGFIEAKKEEEVLSSFSLTFLSHEIMTRMKKNEVGLIERTVQ